MINKETYEQWTKAFSPTSSFEGSWDKGAKILFTSISEEGKKGGMVSRIAENIPNKFISIRHLGMLDGDQEITRGEEIEKWINAIESYYFNETNMGTDVKEELDLQDEYKTMFDEMWNKALVSLKGLCEK